MTKDNDNAKIIRDMIIHESNLINHRLTWVTTLQGFLFAALAFAWKAVPLLAPALVFVGLASSLSVLRSLNLAHRAIQKLLTDWKNATPSKAEPIYNGPDVIGYRSGHPLLLPWFVLPIVLGSAWIYIGFIFYSYPYLAI